MKITQFKKLLAMHGADLTRWEGATPQEIKDFIARTPDAEALYKKAQDLDRALDTFKVDAPDPAILASVLARIGVEPAVRKSGAASNVHPIREPVRKKPAFFSGPFFWGGAAAVAAAAVFFVSTLSAPEPVLGPQGDAQVAFLEEAAPHSQISIGQSGDPDIEVVLAELEVLTAEEIESRAIIGLWQMAEVSAPASQDDAAIDRFLDELFAIPPAAATPEEENAPKDLWELFLESEAQIREL